MYPTLALEMIIPTYSRPCYLRFSRENLKKIGVRILTPNAEKHIFFVVHCAMRDDEDSNEQANDTLMAFIASEDGEVRHLQIFNIHFFSLPALCTYSWGPPFPPRCRRPRGAHHRQPCGFNWEDCAWRARGDNAGKEINSLRTLCACRYKTVANFLPLLPRNNNPAQAPSPH